MRIIKVVDIGQVGQWEPLIEVWFKDPKAVWVMCGRDSSRTIWKFVKKEGKPIKITGGGVRDDEFSVSEEAALYLDSKVKKKSVGGGRVIFV